MKALRYQIKALHALKSGAYTASLYCDGKKVADVEDDGRGGSPRVYWLDGKAYANGSAYDEFVTWFADVVPEWHWSWTFIAGGQVEELGIAFLIDVAEWNRLAKKGNVLVFRKPGTSDPYAPEQTYTQPIQVGHVGEQIAAARLEGLQVWEYGEQRWVA